MQMDIRAVLPLAVIPDSGHAEPVWSCIVWSQGALKAAVRAWHAWEAEGVWGLCLLRRT